MSVGSATTRTGLKFLRDVIITLAPLIGMYIDTGSLDWELFLPALTLGVYRGARDVWPAFRNATGNK